MTEELDIPGKIVITLFDAADFLRDESDDDAYLAAVRDLGDPVLVVKALSAVERARSNR